jgi:RHH-type transcriptional regulator, rel operon repressor / antitoxin RelB
MASDHDETDKTNTMTVRLAPEISEKLGALARDTNRSKSYLAGEAIASFVDVNAWQVARITRALDDARSGGPGVRHSEVAEWMNSWGTDHPLPRPEPKQSK